MSLDVTPEYAKSLGRIGGQLLASNLEFQGQDIQFDTDLLYFDVANKRIGINNYGTSPYELYIGTAASDQKIEAVNFIVDGLTTTNNNWTIQTNNIQPPAAGTLYIRPLQGGNPIISTNGVGDDKINIVDRLIYAKAINDNINISPTSTLTNITGNLEVHGTSGLTYITGYVVVDGDYLAGSQINFGDQTSDVIDFKAEINSDLIPKADNIDSLGNTQERWGFLNTYNLTATTVSNTIGTLGGISIRASNIFSANTAQDIRISPYVSVLTTQVNQNLSGTSSPTGFFFYGWQPLHPGQSEPTFNVIQVGWTVVGHPTWIVTAVGNGVTNYDVTISGGEFASGGTYSFTGPVDNAGNVLLNGLPFVRENTIFNNTANTANPPYYLLSTADGYIRFAGSTGIVVPAGSDAERVTEILGTTRFNTDSGFLEIFNGTYWQNGTGVAPLATQQNVEDDAVIYDLMLG